LGAFFIYEKRLPKRRVAPEWLLKRAEISELRYVSKYISYFGFLFVECFIYVKDTKKENCNETRKGSVF